MKEKNILHRFLLIHIRFIQEEFGQPLTLQSKANLLASIMAAFLSLSDSNANTTESPFFACQNNAWAAAFPPPLTPQS